MGKKKSLLGYVHPKWLEVFKYESHYFDSVLTPLIYRGKRWGPDNKKKVRITIEELD